MKEYTCNRMDGFHIHYAKLKKRDSKNDVLYIVLHYDILEKAEAVGTDNSGCQGMESEEKG